MTETDRTVIVSAAARMTRVQLAPMLPIARMKLAGLTAAAPSYVIEAARALVAALDQWTADEQEIDRDARS